MMKLFYSPGACSLAPHIALRETGQDVTLERVDLSEKRTETGMDFWAINPKGYVPVLQLDDGAVLTEGVVIQQYIADRSPEIRLAPPRGSTERPARMARGPNVRIVAQGAQCRRIEFQLTSQYRSLAWRVCVTFALRDSILSVMAAAGRYGFSMLVDERATL